MWTALALSLVVSAQLQVFGALFQYTDNQGNQHIVSDKDLVPPRYRRNIQILDDEGQILGELEQNTNANAGDNDHLERLKARGRGQKIKK